MDDSLTDLYCRFDGPIPEALERSVPVSASEEQSVRLRQAWDRYARLTAADVARRRQRLPASSLETDAILADLARRLRHVRRLSLMALRTGVADPRA